MTQIRRIIPAYAGSTSTSTSRRLEIADHPRIRGEHVIFRDDQALSKGSSPHTRGAPARFLGGAWLWRIIPAYAGSTVHRRPHLRRRRDHPRIRGEHRFRAFSAPRRRGSSPHTRGALLQDIPAVGLFLDHPRIRGEHLARTVSRSSGRGSSPHTRGALEMTLHKNGLVGIIPAYAGSTLGNPCNTKDRRCDYTSFPLPVTHPSGGGGS